MFDQVKLSKALSYWLRHKPEAGGLQLDAQGWTMVDAVLRALEDRGFAVDRAALDAMVADNSKQRFEFSADGCQIRARQGHSITVALDWPECQPPEFLYHGTVDRFLTPIMGEGLKPMKRHHVHLSPDIATAEQVGARRGKPVILKVRSGEMAAAGSIFLLTDNNVWLTDSVPPNYLDMLT